MALPHPDVNAVLRFPAKLGTSHKKAPQNLFKTPFAPSNFPPRRHTAAPHVFLRRAGRLCPPKHRTPCPSVGGDAHIAPHTAPAVSFRASDRRHWRGNPFPAPAGAEHPPPSVREVSTRSVDGGIVTSGRGRAPPLHTSADSLCAIRAGGCGHPPLRNHRRRIRHTHGRTEPSRPYNRLSTAKTLSKPAAKGRHLPLPQSGKGAI